MSKSKAAKAMKTVGVLNDQNVLVGSTTVTIDTDGLDIGDLPTDGTYKYDHDREHFVPLGHGFGKVKTTEPYDPMLVTATLIDVIEKAGIELPAILTDWRNWYNQEMRRRHEELASRPR